MCTNPSNPLFSWRIKKSQRNKKHHTMLWFYAPSIELFAGACLPAGSRATVSSFLFKQASLLGSRQTPTSECSTAILRYVEGVIWSPKHLLPGPDHPCASNYSWIASLSQCCGALGQVRRQKLRQPTHTMNHWMCLLTTIAASPALS